jgi:small-conductance mechanosensitive channel
MPENRFVYSTAEGVIVLLENLLEAAFGPGIRAKVSGEVTWADLILLLALLVLVLGAYRFVAARFRRKEEDVHPHPETQERRVLVLRTVAKPACFLIWIYGVYFALMPMLLRLNAPGGRHPIRQAVDKLFDLGLFVSLLWLFRRFTLVVDAWLQIAAARSKSKINSLLAPLVGKTLRVVGPIIAIILALPLIGLSPESSVVIGKASSLMIVGSLTWVLLQMVGVVEKAILTRFDITAADNIEARKIYTQVHVIGKSMRVLVGLFGLASMLMVFEEVRRLGASILASAGIVGVVAGFAAQRTIANLFAGFQLALTQPMRIDDVLVVEGEWGRVEEITLTYVVVRIWDERRLIVPLSYFIEKPFQNWTRVSADLLGSVFIYTDYSVPIEAVREEVRRIVEGSLDWDKRFWNVQVTDATDRALQIRILATSADSGKSWNLRCEIRERLITFLQERHPESFPRFRAQFHPSEFRAVASTSGQSIEPGRNGAETLAGVSPKDGSPRVLSPE